MKTSQIGKFHIHRDMILRDESVVLRVMAKCIVVRCELLYHNESFEYVALSEEFAEVPEAGAIPTYNIVFSDNRQTVTFVAAQ